MTQDRATPDAGANQTPYQQMVGDSYYAVLGIQPAASAQQIRQAYRDLSKLYHPDTTTLAAASATSKFQQLNEAYATLSNPERRRVYDQKIGYSRVAVVQPLPSLKQTARAPASSSAYLDATDRPLSPGEIFAIFILGVTVVGCLVLAIAIGITQGPTVLDPITAIMPQPIIPHPPVPLNGIQALSEPPPAQRASPKALNSVQAEPSDAVLDTDPAHRLPQVPEPLLNPISQSSADPG